MTDEVAGRLQEQRIREGRIARGDPPDLPAPDKSMIPPQYRHPDNAPENWIMFGGKTPEQVQEDYRSWEWQQLVRRNPQVVDELLSDHALARAERLRREKISGHKVNKLPDELASWALADLEAARLAVEIAGPELDPNPEATTAERKRRRDAAQAKIAEANAEIVELDPWRANL